MHWYIPTQVEDVNDGGTFWTNACLAEGSRHTEDPKKVTCRRCKALYEHPTNVSMAAAKLLQAVQAIQEDGDYLVEVRCNACCLDLDVSVALIDQSHDMVRHISRFLEHVAFEHMGGADVMLVRVQNFMSAYENNYSVGKIAMTDYEQEWRERMELVHA
jgi:hypothetical protein